VSPGPAPLPAARSRDPDPALAQGMKFHKDRKSQNSGADFTTRAKQEEALVRHRAIPKPHPWKLFRLKLKEETMQGSH